MGVWRGGGRRRRRRRRVKRSRYGPEKGANRAPQRRSEERRKKEGGDGRDEPNVSGHVGSRASRTNAQTEATQGERCNSPQISGISSDGRVHVSIFRPSNCGRPFASLSRALAISSLPNGHAWRSRPGNGAGTNGRRKGAFSINAKAQGDETGDPQIERKRRVQVLPKQKKRLQLPTKWKKQNGRERWGSALGPARKAERCTRTALTNR